MPRKITTEIFIERATKKHGNTYDYSLVNYKGCSKKINIICKKHGIFEQTPSNHLNKNGCYKCGREKVANKQRTSLEEIIKRGRVIHGNKYDYSKVKYKRCKDKVIIICPIHGDFKQTIDKHIGQKYGCQKCGYEKTAEFNRDNKRTFIEKAVRKHGNMYDYSLINYVNSQTNVKILCKVHGIFEQRPNAHIRGNGCGKCVRTLHNATTEEWIKLAIEKHNGKYDYSQVKYIKCDSKIKIICPEHGLFKQKADVHLKGHGCSKCSKCYQYTTKEWIEEAKKVHGDKYDYSKTEYINNRTGVVIICHTHGDFWQTAGIHINQECGCPRCYKRHSKQQIQWLKYLSVHREIQHAETENGEYNVPNTFYSADGYEAKTNTIFEYHGSFWHGNPNIHNPNDVNPVTKKKFGQLFKNTIKKEILLRNLGYNYKCIWDVDWIKGVNAGITLQKLWKNKK